MGISDRYYMNDSEESVNYAGRRFSATVIIIALNVIIWVIWQFAKNDYGSTLYAFMDANFKVDAAGVLSQYRIHTLVTAAFSHISITHILFNMMFFWFLAEDVERIYGFRNFIWLYIFTGAISSLAFIGLDVLKSGGEIHAGHPMLGASGAVMGIAIVATIFDPNKPTAFFGLIRMPLKWLVLIYVMFDILGVSEQTNDIDRRIAGGSLIAHIAHLGGALGGLLYYFLDLRMFSSPGRSDVGIWNKVRKWFRRGPALRLREREIPQELPREVVAKAERGGRSAVGSSRPSARSVDAATSERVDELLGKISREGIGALTDEERSFLQESSQKYKK